MIFTESHFNRIKDEKSYKKNFNDYQTAEEFNSYVKNTLETENINILINNIIRIMNIVNETNEDNTELDIKELILKANLSQNRTNFEEVLKELDNNSEERIIKINRIFDKKLLNNFDIKIDLLIKIEKLCEYFYPDFPDKLSMQSFEGVLKDENISTVNKKRKVNYSTLDIRELCKELTDEQKDSLIDCLLKDKNIWDKINKIFPKIFPRERIKK